MTRFQAMRMIWIDAWLESSEFPLNRKHLQQVFDLSTPQASYDLSRFQGLWPARLHYDRSLKGYVAAGPAVYEPWMHESVFSAGRAAKEACENHD